jgi:hypothetical protein
MGNFGARAGRYAGVRLYVTLWGTAVTRNRHSQACVRLHVTIGAQRSHATSSVRYACVCMSRMGHRGHTQHAASGMGTFGARADRYACVVCNIYGTAVTRNTQRQAWAPLVLEQAGMKVCVRLHVTSGAQRARNKQRQVCVRLHVTYGAPRSHATSTVRHGHLWC